MADPSITIGYQILILAEGLSFLAGFLINMFIVAVNISEWKKGGSMSTPDKVITSLGISRMVFPVGCMCYVIWDIYFYRLDSFFFIPVEFLEITSVYSSIWLSTLLSVVFFLKISTLHNAFFLRLKILVLNRVFHLIVASVVVSSGYALLYCLTTFFKISHNSTYQTYDNVYIGFEFSGLIFFHYGPFLIYFISSVLLIVYLSHHMRQMRSKGSRTSHLAYSKTIKFTGFSLFCSSVYTIIALTASYYYKIFGLTGIYFLWNIFPTLHSMYLIYVTAKLRVQVSNVVQWYRRCCVPKAQVETIFH
ncbi:hypothetical protein PRIEUP_LOCUS819 [Pristimantis euphronides]